MTPHPHQVNVPFAATRNIVAGTLIGFIVGQLIGIGGVIGGAVGCTVATLLEPLVNVSPRTFVALIRNRHATFAQIQENQPSWRQYLYRLMRNTVIACAAISALLLGLALLSVAPKDMGLATGEVESKRFYLTLAVVPSALIAALLLLIWGVALDFAERRSSRAVLGIAAFVVEAIGVAALNGSIRRPANVYADIFVVLLTWGACFPWNPVRWLRYWKYGQFSRFATTISDVVGATPRKVYVSRQPPPPLGTSSPAGTTRRAGN